MTAPDGRAPSLIRASWEIRPPNGGATIRGDLRAPSGPAPETAIVICHGFKGFRRWGFFPTLTRALAMRGHAAISFDFSHNGVGADGVDFSALDLFSEATHSRNVDEIRMVLDAVTGGKLFPRPPRHVGLMGHSRGGGEAVVAASEDDRLSALVTWAAISRMERWSADQIAAWNRGETIHIENARTSQQMPIAPAYWRDLKENAERLDVLAAARRVEVPWLIIHGEDDETVPISEGRALHEASNDAEFLPVEGAGHTFGAAHPFRGTPPPLATAIGATCDWFARMLGSDGTVL